MAPSLTEWLERCAAARSANQPIPEAALFRRVVAHDEFVVCVAEGVAPDEEIVLGGEGGVVDVFCAAELAPTDAPVRSLTGLQLTATIAAGTREMRLVFGGAESVLVLTDDEVAHFRTFLQVAPPPPPELGCRRGRRRFHSPADGSSARVGRAASRMPCWSAFLAYLHAGEISSRLFSSDLR
jgi:hypothetical protein